MGSFGSVQGSTTWRHRVESCRSGQTVYRYMPEESEAAAFSAKGAREFEALAKAKLGHTADDMTGSDGRSAEILANVGNPHCGAMS